jgi:hypothetical protein
MRFVLVISLVLSSVLSFRAQSDSVLCDVNCKVNEGIYLSYDDFRSNRPLTREQIESSMNKDQLDFFGKILSQPKFVFDYNGQKVSKDSRSAWGYYQNNILHVNYNGDYYRVPVFGSICYLVAQVEVVSPALYTPVYGGGMGMGTTVRTQEIRNFLMSFYDGIISPYSQDLAESLIARDADLYKEFKSLKSKQQKDQVARYIRKYNELHPVYFLASR